MKLLGLTARKRIEELEELVERLRSEIEEFHRRQSQLEDENRDLRNESDKLRRERDRLRQELELARRAAKRQAAPFSKGGPKENPGKPGRKPGAEYGRKAHRAVPLQVDEEWDAFLPDACPRCGGEIDHQRVEEQYQSEIVRKTRVIRFRVHVGACVDCGARIQGRHERQTSDALGAAASQLGPEALALATVLNKRIGIPFGKTAEVLESAFGLQVTPGGLSQAIARVRTSCEPTYEALKQHVRTSLSVTMDESGWKVAAILWWLWVAVTPEVTVYGILPGRGFREAAALIGPDFEGFLIHDGWKVYYQFMRAFHQSCQRHLLNRCDRMLLDVTPGGAVFPSRVKTMLLKGLDLRDRHEAGTVSDHGLWVATGRLESEMEHLLDRTYRLPDNQRLANHLIHEFDHLFTYLKCPGLEATNYRGEQAVRPAAVIRKVWGGNRTTNGAHTQEVLMSVLQTSRQQGKDPVPLLVDLLCRRSPCVLDLVPSRASPN